MNNEILFCCHAFIALLFLLIADRLGKGTLMTYIAASWLFANFFVIKQIDLFSYTVTSGEIYTIGGMYGMSLLQERFGPNEARRAVINSFFLLTAATLFAIAHLLYLPSDCDRTHEAFQTLLFSTPRLMLASITTFYIASQIEIRLFQILQQKLSCSFTIRSTVTLFFVSAIDTFLFTLLGLYGLIEQPLYVFTMSLCMKIIIALSTAPLILLITKFHPLTPKKAL